MALESKDATIKRIYYDVEDGYGSMRETFNKAKAINPDIKYEDVRAFMEKQKVHQLKHQRGSTRFVAKYPRHEFQMDLMDFTRSAEVNHGYRYGLVAVDVFSKKIHVIPI